MLSYSTGVLRALFISLLSSCFVCSFPQELLPAGAAHKVKTVHIDRQTHAHTHCSKAHRIAWYIITVREDKHNTTFRVLIHTLTYKKKNHVLVLPCALSTGGRHTYLVGHIEYIHFKKKKRVRQSPGLKYGRIASSPLVPPRSGRRKTACPRRQAPSSSTRIPRP